MNDTTDPDEQAIRELIDTWMIASARGDSGRVLSLMADDVVFLVVGSAPMRGKAAFAAAQKGLEGARIEAASDVQEIRVFGDWAYCWNKLSVTITPGAGKAPIERAGNVLSVLRKEDGRWVIFRDANLLSVVPR
jgi:uncharacterized protein (TIGR02246 family)